MSARGNFDRRFALGVYDSGGSYSTDRTFWEEAVFGNGRGLQGFPLNVYLNYWLGDMPIAQTRALLDVLQSRRMMYLQTGNAFGWGSWKRIHFSIASQEYVQAFAQHPAALGYYIADEPTLSVLTETEEHHRQLKSWDPDGLTFAALMAGYAGQPPEPTRTAPAKWINAADVLGVDPYPLYGPEPAAGYAHFSVAEYMSKLRAAVPVGRPVWAVLQFFKGTSDSRLPTVDEMRAHAVMAIVEGATGIFWWDIGVNGIRNGATSATVATYMGHLKALVTELAGLEPALLAPNVNHLLVNSTTFPDPVAGRISQLRHNIAVEWLYSRKQWYQEELDALLACDRSKSGGMLVGAANVRTLSKVWDEHGYVFAYNYTNQSQTVTFNAASTVTWSDTFEPYGARIYVLTPLPNGLISVVESKSGKVYPANNAPVPAPPPIVVTPLPVTPPPAPAPAPAPPPAPSGRFTVAFLGPSSGQRVSGSQTVGIGIPAEFWAHPKRVRLHVGGVNILNATAPTGTAWWPQWDTRRSPNGPAVLTAEVMIDGQTATATLPVVVAN